MDLALNEFVSFLLEEDYDSAQDFISNISNNQYQLLLKNELSWFSNSARDAILTQDMLKSNLDFVISLYELYFDNVMLDVLSYLDAELTTLFGGLDVNTIQLSSRTQYMKLRHLQAKYRYHIGQFEEFYHFSNENFKLSSNWQLLGEIADAYSNIGIFYWVKGDLNQGLEFLLKALESAENCNDKLRVGTIQNNIGILYQARDELDEAIIYHQKSEDTLLSINDTLKLELTLNSFGFALYRRGFYQEAEIKYTNAIELAEANNKHQYLSYYYANMGALAHLRGDLDEALDLYKFQLQRNLETGNNLITGRAYHNVGLVLIDKGQLNHAREHLQLAFEYLSKDQNPTELAKTLSVMFELELNTKNYNTAEEILNKIYELDSQDTRIIRQIQSLVRALWSYEFDNDLDLASSLLLEIITQEQPYHFDISFQCLLYYIKTQAELCTHLEDLDFHFIKAKVIEFKTHAENNYLILPLLELILVESKIIHIEGNLDKSLQLLITAIDIAETHNLQFFYDNLQEEKNYILEQVAISENALQYHEFDIVDLKTFIEDVISKSYEYQLKISTYHYETGERTLCGISLVELKAQEKQYGLSEQTIAKCKKCRALFEYQNLSTIIQRRIMNQVCYSCDKQVSLTDSVKIVESHFNQSSGKNAGLVLNSDLLQKKISWSCPYCKDDQQNSFMIESIFKFS